MKLGVCMPTSSPTPISTKRTWLSWGTLASGMLQKMKPFTECFLFASCTRGAEFSCLGIVMNARVATGSMSAAPPPEIVGLQHEHQNCRQMAQHQK